MDTRRDKKYPCITRQDERKKGKRRGEEAGQDLEGQLKQSRGSASGEAPSLTGKSVGKEGEHLRLSEEGEMAGLWQIGEGETYTDSPCHSPECPRLGHEYASAHEG